MKWKFKTSAAEIKVEKAKIITYTLPDHFNEAAWLEKKFGIERRDDETEEKYLYRINYGCEEREIIKKYYEDRNY